MQPNVQQLEDGQGDKVDWMLRRGVGSDWPIFNWHLVAMPGNRLGICYRIDSVLNILAL